ncbi:glycerol-3-phosphate phosphatase-like isoform X2 [Limulus polyphemus]|uniref:Glycerol-3-phosphate phosphatase-like isoform X2 n=1 Tax=Limulus polyphemus TaxID=6850 RepID=A0ABM1SBL9_LIMPO|nr:glycerol-3-phosphate phosphatase-like isoform X2 [Limulus polyphemus]
MMLWIKFSLGVLWNRNEAIPGAKETINALQDMGKTVIFVTNNSSKSRYEYHRKCEVLGFKSSVDRIFPTSYCVAVYLKSIDFKKKVYVLGSSGIAGELHSAGIPFLPVGPDPMPETEYWYNWVAKELKLDSEVGAVVVGFDQHVSYPKLVKTVSYLKDPNCVYIATNIDEQFQTDLKHLVIPGTGAFIRAVEAVSGRTPIVLGKPAKFLYDCIKYQYPDLDPSKGIIIGDRLSTDILLGRSTGLRTLLVLTGVSDLNEVERCSNSNCENKQMMVPDYYLPSLADLGRLMGVIQ